jgi:NhaP-type Na+/H+ or K+/H+ antiporter/Trk K+ transport system NAD-binding subunit
MDSSSIALIVGVALGAGMIVQALARHLRIPGIVLLLATGVALGPDGLNIIRPHDLGVGLETIVTMSVAVILFEGGLALDISRLRGEARPIRHLVTVGGLVTAIGGTLAARLFMGWDWRLAVLFGTLVIVTGPTVITPLLRRFKVRRNLDTILAAEGVLIDPIGVIIAVVALEVVLTTSGPAAAEGLLGLPYRIGVGVVIGAVGGLGLSLLLGRRRLVPDGFENVFTLGVVLALVALSDAVVSESGIVTAVVSGMVVGNMKPRSMRDLQEFKEQLSVMLIGLLFVLLAADVRIADVRALGWPGLATVIALIVIVRPVDVAVSTAGTSLTGRERAFLGWMAPRGIVAAAAASLFAQELARNGFAGGEQLRALVFLVIAVTVSVAGLTGGLAASLLGVRRPMGKGYAIAGANPIGCAVGAALAAAGEDIVVVDQNRSLCRKARAAGLTVVNGNLNAEETLVTADVETRYGFIALTPSEGVNMLLAGRIAEEFRLPRSYVAIAPGGAIEAAQVAESGQHLLFGTEVDLELWIHRFNRGKVAIEPWRLDTPPDAADAEDSAAQDRKPRNALALARVRGKLAQPVDEETRYREGDIVQLALATDYADEVTEWLRGLGWVPASESSEAAVEA